MKRLLYGEAYKILAEVAVELLPLFADKWERFPTGYNAIKIIDALTEKKDMYYKYKLKEAAEKCNDVASEIIIRAEG